MKIVGGLLLALATVVMITGCATIVTGTKQSIPVNSTPSGATINVDGETRGTTPTTLELPRGSHVVVLTKEGYKTSSVVMGTKLNGWLIGNILIGGLIGIVIDLVSGAAVWIDPESINVSLEKAGQSKIDDSEPDPSLPVLLDKAPIPLEESMNRGIE